ncbi:DUF2244 domain-containing protein [Geminicoccaceae bacterium 1502E]|nr:DUF2244 domain-containing protein [Geminicoccaceae bacterium 1502E]
MAGESDGPRPFEAILYPNQPMGRYGFAIFMTLLCGASFALGAMFVLLGAWPVSGFLGLDVLLLWLAFRCSHRQARRFEAIRLDAHGLQVRRVDAKGRQQEWHFDPYWVRVAVEQRRDGPAALTLASHGRRLAIGGFLTAAEQREVAIALNAALSSYR